MRYKKFITEVLMQSAKISLRYFGKVIGTTKPGDNNQVLTEADLRVGEYIIDSIKAIYPHYNIIDEEAGVINNNSEFTWVIDPIDGTSNFAQGVVTYGIILGLLHYDIPIAGGIALPAFSEIYVAEKGFGAFYNNQKIIIDDNRDDLLSELVAYGIDGHQEIPQITRNECKLLAEIILNIRSLRVSGCVFDSMMVLKGKYGAHLVNVSRIWDNVGLQIIIQEAGGLCTDFFGKPINYKNPLSKIKNNLPLCVAPPKLHKAIQQIIHRDRENLQ